jgi:hypothetical protein
LISINKYWLMVIAGLGLLYYSCNPGPDCSDFKTGNFYFYSKRNNAKILVARTDSLQTQIDTKERLVRLHRVSWKSPCEYEIQPILPRAMRGPDSTGKIFAPLVTSVRIIESNEKFYICSVGAAAPPLFPEQRDTIWVDK